MSDITYNPWTTKLDWNGPLEGTKLYFDKDVYFELTYNSLRLIVHGENVMEYAFAPGVSGVPIGMLAGVTYA